MQTYRDPNPSPYQSANYYREPKPNLTIAARSTIRAIRSVMVRNPDGRLAYELAEEQMRGYGHPASHRQLSAIVDAAWPAPNTRCHDCEQPFYSPTAGKYSRDLCGGCVADRYL